MPKSFNERMMDKLTSGSSSQPSMARALLPTPLASPPPDHFLQQQMEDQMQQMQHQQTKHMQMLHVSTQGTGIQPMWAQQTPRPPMQQLPPTEQQLRMQSAPWRTFQAGQACQPSQTALPSKTGLPSQTGLPIQTSLPSQTMSDHGAQGPQELISKEMVDSMIQQRVAESKKRPWGRC